MVKKETALAALEQEFQTALTFMNQPAKNWVHQRLAPDGKKALDVAIIGAGASGLSVAFALKREGVRNIAVFDQNPRGEEGPWVTTARMRTLRSPKHLTGPHQGIASLTFRAWYRAVYGEEAWEKLDKIPREIWMAYLCWYRKITAPFVQNDICLKSLKSEGDFWHLLLDSENGSRLQYARHVVLATGRAASGGVALPPVADAIPASLRAHTEDQIDFRQLKGARILVVGGAASAVDAAATALENGAAQVDMLVRSPELPTLNKFKYIVYPGFMRGFHKLPADKKWAFLKEGFDAKVAAPRDSMLRLKAHENFNLYLGAGLISASCSEKNLTLTTQRGQFTGDFVIFGTGYAMDLQKQPELASLAADIRLWKDEFQPPSGGEDDPLLTYPFLGDGFQFLPKYEGENCSGLDRLHLFNAATTMSHAPVSSDIPGTNIGTERLVDHLIGRLFCDNAEAHLEEMQNYAEPELLGDEWIER
ncbi:flavin-containing monooxygenase [Sneathiella aquimaris]|uniref:flavin-containing monooxygenase n=1 Tax=Sneathiella aquimaris TaxID=2599305 RepID=UPI00146D255E|nr:NAD(P)/FAD-dependent oxidoreductase [Sneathiella aquimaris]